LKGILEVDSGISWGFAVILKLSQPFSPFFRLQEMCSNPRTACPA
jgi:hypothetical protein